MESGGGATNTGGATIVCGPTGEMVEPLFVPKGYCNDNHAVFVAQPGMCLVEAAMGCRGEDVTVYRIITIGTPDDPDALILEEVCSYADGDWNGFLADFRRAAEAALSKSMCYRCREPHYVA